MAYPDLISFLGYLSQYSFQFAKAARFDVMIVPPAGIPNSSLAASQLIFQCEMTELPGRVLSTFETRTYGPILKYPYQSTYTDLSLNFFCTASMWEKTFFDAWIDLVNPVDSVQTGSPKFNFNYKNTYATNITITQYDEIGNATYAVQVLEAFPIAVNPLPLDWSSDAIHKLNVNFAYTRWTTNPAGSSGPSTVSTSSGSAFTSSSSSGFSAPGSTSAF